MPPELLNNKKPHKKAKAKLNYIKNNFEKNLEQYQAQEEILAERNSHTKTDHDATFMRVKDDHIMNRQLKPAYMHKSPPKTKSL